MECPVERICENREGLFGKIALCAGIVAIVFALLPLLSSWFFNFTGVMWLAAVVTVAAIILSLMKKDNSSAGILACGAVLVVASFLVPTVFKTSYYSAKAEQAIGIVDDIVEACDIDEVVDIASEAVDDGVDVAMKAAVKYAKDYDKLEDIGRGSRRSHRYDDFDDFDF